MRTFVAAKVHGLRVTDKSLHYNGSQTLPVSVMNAAGILPYEQVHCLNMNNGARLRRRRVRLHACPGNHRLADMVSAAIYFNDPDRLIPPPLSPTDWLPTHATTEQAFRQFLDQAGIEVHSNVQGQQEYLILFSGASIVFADGRLHSIHFKRRDKKTSAQADDGFLARRCGGKTSTPCA